MSKQHFVIMQCTAAGCRFRFPAEWADDLTLSCPQCGKATERVTDPFQNLPPRRIRGSSNRYQVYALLDNLRSAYNVGSIFRTASAVELDHLYLCGTTPSPAHSRVAKTSLGAEGFVSWSAHNNSLDLAEKLIAEGHFLAALEGGTKSQWLTDLAPQPGISHITLIVGNERSGIDPELMILSHQVLALPMMGAKSSLNVTVAFGIAAYYIQFLFEREFMDE
jgi:tRNA G18 (ribose-2'-O)-methylase SpoU